jgi:serine/threonine protein kinase
VGGLLCVLCTAVVIITATTIYAVNQRKQAKRQTKEIELLESSLEIGNFLKQYKIDSKDIKIKKHIGSGASATVYTAEWENKTVAYKIFKAVDSEDIKDFEYEAKIMIESNHPNIVHLYRVCIKQGTFGLVMEYMNMGTLKEVLKKEKGKITWAAKWNIAYDLAAALKFLHSKDVIHRDIKTDNVLLYKEGNEIHAKMADFGLSKAQKTKGKSATMGIGTFKYMAPEMVLGVEGYEIGQFPMEPVDVYALGMTYVALITEEEPYPKMQNVMSIPSQVGGGKLYQELNENKCPFMFFSLTERCRHPKSEKRPTAEEIIKELNGMKDQVVNFNLTDNLMIGKPQDDSKRKVISM